MRIVSNWFHLRFHCLGKGLGCVTNIDSALLSSQLAYCSQTFSINHITEFIIHQKGFDSEREDLEGGLTQTKNGPCGEVSPREVKILLRLKNLNQEYGGY